MKNKCHVNNSSYGDEVAGSYSSMSYNAVQYEYNPRLLARPSAHMGKMSPALKKFRDNINRMKTAAIKFVSESVSRSDENSNLEPDVESGEYIPITTQKVKKKKSKKSKIDAEENSTVELKQTVNNDEADQSSDKKKKKKSKRNKEEPCLDVNMIAPELPSKKKKKRKQIVDDEVTNCSEPEIESILTSKPSKKGKNKQTPCPDDAKVEESEPDIVEVTNRSAKKKKKRKIRDAECEAVTPAVEIVEVQEPKKSKKKKRRSEPDADVIVADIEIQEPEPSKKKKKKRKNQSSDELVQDSGADEKAADSPLKKKRKRDKDNETATAAEDTATQVITNGGQWNTASLGDESRTNKFLKLMGGLKKGNQNEPSQNGGKHQVNCALNQKQEAELNAQLEEQFVKAKQTIILKGKGVGLGFEKAPGEGKKFFIDTNQTKSTKFDD